MDGNNQEEMKKKAWDRLWERGFLTAGLRKFIPQFEQLSHFYYRKKINQLLKGVSFSQEQILELGCGSGINSINLLKDYGFEKATLVDFSFRALDIAKENTNGYHVEVVCSDIFDLDLSQKFDLVFSIGLIEHFIGERREKAIAVHRRFVKEKGLIMIIVPKKGPLSKIFQFFNKLQGIKDYPFSEKEIRGLFAQNGLEVIKGENLALGIASAYLLKAS